MSKPLSIYWDNPCTCLEQKRENVSMTPYKISEAARQCDSLDFTFFLSASWSD